MNTFDPSNIDHALWSVGDATRRLAEEVANRAVADDGNIPEELLRAFHDAKALKATLDSLKTQATNAAMLEAMS